MDIATETWTASVIVGKSSIFKTVIDQKSQYLWKSFSDVVQTSYSDSFTWIDDISTEQEGLHNFT